MRIQHNNNLAHFPLLLLHYVSQTTKHLLGIIFQEKILNVVLSDNGPEFHKLYELKIDEDTGEKICNVFYCDPYASYQKGECEKNHGLFRRIYPKLTSFHTLTQEEVDEIFPHINSYPRASLGNHTPYELFLKEYNSIIVSLLGIVKVKQSKVTLKPWNR